jgi:serine/threonine-protein kinase
MHLEPGAQFDRFTIEALLGEGGMGQVYRAFDARLRRRVALKILRPRAEGGDPKRPAPDRVSLILREARAAASLDHPNAVAIFELGEHEGVPFMAMELISGVALRTLVGRRDVPVEQRLLWLGDVARALEAAHQAGIVHLDIKPENVMVRSDGVVKVLDFGIARRTAAAPDPADAVSWETARVTLLTEAGALVGTLPYMAPEQIRRLELDGRTDQFAWGVVAYELLAGKMPWPMDGSAFDLLSAILAEPPPSLRPGDPEVPAVVEGIVMRALSKAPADRFASMGELAEALSAVTTGRSMTSGRGVALPPAVAALDNRRLSQLPTESIAVKGKLLEDAVRASAARTLDSARAPVATSTTAPAIGDGTPSPLAMTSGDLEVSPTMVTLPVASGSSLATLVTRELPSSGRRAAVAATEAEPPSVAPPSEPQQASPPTMAGIERPSPSAPPAPGPASARSTRRRWMLAVGAVGAIVTAAALGRWYPPPRTPITALPAPKACNVAATSEVHLGIQALHDGVWEQAHHAFERAVAADGQCAEAHLRLVITGQARYPASKAREVYLRAAQLRERLSERDQLLLEAYEPLVRSDPANLREAGERMRALSARFPGDAELAYLAGSHSEDAAAELASAERGLAIDPHYSDAWQTKGHALARLGKTQEALGVLDECLRAAPNSVDCARERISLLRRIGQCREMAKSARVWISRDPNTSLAYLALAQALGSEGSARGAVEEALRQRWAKLSPPEQAQRQPFEQAMVDVLQGDFASASKQADVLERAADESPDYEPHVRPTLLRLGVMIEGARPAEAARLAATTLERKAAWSSNLRPDSLDVALATFEPRLLVAAPSPAGGAALRAWMSSTREAGLLNEEVLWAMGVAMPVTTPAEATAALETMPASLRAGGGYVRTPAELSGAYVGHALLLAGHAAEATPFLHVATASCFAFDDPFAHTRAHLWLAQALEQQHDVAGACAAYRVVEARWGKATPPSVTAAEATARLAALACR